MVENKYLDKIDQCKKIIDKYKNNPKKCIELMCKLNLVKNKDNEKKFAIEIYEKFADRSIEYEEEKYRNNITQYNKKLNLNIEKAKKSKNI